MYKVQRCPLSNQTTPTTTKYTAAEGFLAIKFLSVIKATDINSHMGEGDYTWHGHNVFNRGMHSWINTVEYCS
jgi:hypothetical protein